MDKWIEIDLDAIAENYKNIRKFVPPSIKILGVVKADAYGHGLVETAKILAAHNIDYLAVTEIEEGIILRKAGLEIPILVFSTPLPENMAMGIDYDLTITLNSLESLQKVLEEKLALKVHLKIETGLGRTGLSLEQIPQVINYLKNVNNLKLEGIYTHLATAMWSNNNFAREQFHKLQTVIDLFAQSGIQFPIRHICNSKALVKFPEMHLDMVRAGTILYGQDSCGAKLAQELQDPWQLKARIISLSSLPKGHSVGYERTHILKRDSQIAVVPIGFFHGFSVEPIPHPKTLKDLAKVLAKNILRYFHHPLVTSYAYLGEYKIPVIGKVGMQLTMLDVTDIPGVKIGDIVTLPGRRTSISPLVEKIFICEQLIQKDVEG